MDDPKSNDENTSNNNTESSNADAQLEETSISVGLNIHAGSNDEFHTLNDPSKPFQRSTISERQGIITVQCLSREVIHGNLSPDEGNATLLVYDLHLDTAKRSRRIRTATIKFEFRSSVTGLSGPRVVKIAPFRRKTLQPTSAEESKTHEFGLSAGASYLVNIEGSAKRGTTVNKTKNDSARVTGYILGDNYGKQVIAQWNLLENELEGSGTPSFMRFAILLNREDSVDDFECKVTIRVKADWKTGIEELFGLTPPDDPVLFKTTLPPTNKLRKTYDLKDLGAIDLDDFVTVIFDKELKKQDEGGSA